MRRFTYERARTPAETAMPRGAVEMSRTVFADARPTSDNAFKIPLATRTLAAVLAEVKP